MKNLLLAIIFCSTACFGQSPYGTFQSTIKKLYSQNADSVFTLLQSQHAIPLVEDDSVAFLYRGEANSVAWMGDFNGWGYYKEVRSQGVRIPGSTIWILKMKFPRDARLDYKIVINESNWILDPANTHQQWSGVGGGSPNSELRMPDWKPDSIQTENPQAPKGTVITDVLLQSKALGYQIMYSVYLPPAYDPQKSYPTLYVSDGYEYMHPQLGNMITVLNNLLYYKKMQPVVVVFVDQRNPINRAENRRMKELAMNSAYRAFYVDELIPVIEQNYAVFSAADSRGILGTSMGGLNAAYFSFTRPDIFGLAAIQSPAFSYRNEIFPICENAVKPPLKIFLSAGTIHDALEGAEKMKGILDSHICAYQFVEMNESHSWGQWKSLLDDILVYFFPVSN